MVDYKGWSKRARKYIALQSTPERILLREALADLEAKEVELAKLEKESQLIKTHLTVCGVAEYHQRTVDIPMWRKRAEEAEAQLATLKTENERLKKELSEARSTAGKARELLLGDTDHSAWHSEHCYRKVAHKSAGCVCGLSEALRLLDEADQGEYFKLVCQLAQANIKHEGQPF